MTTANFEAAAALQVAARKSPLTLSDLRAAFRDGGMAGLGHALALLQEFEREDAAAALALGGKMSYADAQRFVADAVLAWSEHVAALRDEADAIARAALGDNAPVLPAPVALLRKLHELAEQASDRKPYARAAAAIVEGIEMHRDHDGLHVASQSEHGKVHTVNGHGCNCRAKAGCWHEALYAATVELDAE